MKLGIKRRDAEIRGEKRLLLCVPLRSLRLCVEGSLL